MARRLVREGGRVVVADLNGEAPEAVASELESAVGIGLDVADEASFVTGAVTVVDGGFTAV